MHWHFLHPADVVPPPAAACTVLAKQVGRDGYGQPEEVEAEKVEFLAQHPYICQVTRCKKRFSTKGERDRHMRNLHKD